MATGKAIPLNVVCSDKGQKSRQIGKAFINLDGNPPLSLTISLSDLRTAITDKVVSETDYKANPQYPDRVLDGKRVIRLAGFKMERRSSI